MCEKDETVVAHFSVVKTEKYMYYYCNGCDFWSAFPRAGGLKETIDMVIGGHASRCPSAVTVPVIPQVVDKKGGAE